MLTLLALKWDFAPNIIPDWDIPRYYSVCMALAFMSAYFVIKKIYRKQGIDLAVLEDLTFYVIAGGIIGARLGHVFFYQPEYYLSHPIDIIKIWEGGLASHGGAIGILIAVLLFKRKRAEIPTLRILDIMAIAIPLSAMFIRLGNFFNSEILGDPTDGPFGIVFVREDGINGPARHPAQLYEAIYYLFTFLVMYSVYLKTTFIENRGKLFGLFLILLFTGRAYLESFKEKLAETDGESILRMGQMLSIPFVLVGIYLLFFYKKLESK